MTSAPFIVNTGFDKAKGEDVLRSDADALFEIFPPLPVPGRFGDACSRPGFRIE
jgi:hypothetical protein